MSNVLRLSEAIRLGAMMKPQAFNQWSKTGTCALAAAAEVVGLEVGTSQVTFINYRGLRKRFPVLNQRCASPCNCPDDSGNEELIRTIWHLNDRHHVSRERIADFVATLENVPEPAPSGTLATLSAG